MFSLDTEWEKHEEEWAVIRKEIIGEDEYLGEEAEEEESDEEEDHNQNIIQDLTNRDQNTLRRTLYLTIMSSVDFEECSNKILKLNIREGQEREVCHMMVECCMNERSYEMLVVREFSPTLAHLQNPQIVHGFAELPDLSRGSMLHQEHLSVKEEQRCC